MREDLYWFWRNHVGVHFSKLFCWLWGHPEEVYGWRLAIVVNNVVVVEACTACGRKIFEWPKDKPLTDSPDYDPTPPEGEEYDCCR